VKALAAHPKFDTLADIVAALGGIPPHRIRFRPYPGTAEEYHLSDVSIPNIRACELIDGTLVEKAMGIRSEYIGMWIATIFGRFPDIDDVGAILGSQAYLRLFPGTVRMPDVAFIRWDSMADPDELEDPAGAFLDTAPDLIVEVLSPGNTAGEMTRKLGEYATAGVKIVWIVDPETQTVEVFTKAKLKHKKTYTIGDTLDGGKVLPGFTLPVETIFAKRAPGKGKKKR